MNRILKIVITCLFCCTSITSPAQKIEVDSVDHLIALAEKQIKTNVAEAELLSKKALQISDDIAYSAGSAKSLQVLAKVYYNLNKNEEAIQSALKASEIFISNKDSVNAGLSLNQVGNVYMQKMSHFTMAFEYYSKAMTYLRHDSATLIRTLNNVGTLYNRTENFEKALETYKKVYEIAERTKDLFMSSTASNNIGAAYHNRKDYASSIYYFEKGLRVKEMLKDYPGIANGYNNLALAYGSLDEHQKAQEMINKALEVSEKYSLYDNLIYTLMAQGDEYERVGDFKNAILTYEKSEAIAQEKNAVFFYKLIYENLSDLHTKTGNVNKALIYQRKVSRITDSLARAERKAIAELNGKKEIASETVAAPQNGFIWVYFFGGGIICCVAIVLIVKKKQKSNLLDTGSATELINKSVTTTANASTHLEVLNGEGFKILDLEEAYWFEKKDKDYLVYTEHESYKVKQNINELEIILPDSIFFKVNRGVIININKIKNYSFWEHHKYIIRMDHNNKPEFIITRARFRTMKDKFNLVDTID